MLILIAGEYDDKYLGIKNIQRFKPRTFKQYSSEFDCLPVVSETYR